MVSNIVLFNCDSSNPHKTNKTDSQSPYRIIKTTWVKITIYYMRVLVIRWDNSTVVYKNKYLRNLTILNCKIFSTECDKKFLYIPDLVYAKSRSKEKLEV